MIEAKDKTGQVVYISYIRDCEDNPDGYYCETYADQNGDRKIDDFVIRPADIRGFLKMNDQKRTVAIQKYCRRYYEKNVLNLSHNF